MWRKAGKISEKLSWMCSVYFCGLIPKHDWWFYFEVSGQLLLSLTKPLFITSLTNKVCGSELKPGSAALGAWGEALCFFPFVVDLNHPFETHSQCFPNLALGSFVGNSADTEHQSLWWKEPFPEDSRFAVCQLHPCCSSCFYPAAVGFNSSATFGWQGNSRVFSFPFTWTSIPSGFGTHLQWHLQ